jgi:site-specific DNA-cytosine methylase
MALTAIDLCCGAGGWIEAARGLPIRWLLAADWAEDCCLTVRLNHPDVPVVCADVTTMDMAKLAGRVDLVVGAIPCEEISGARNNRRASDSEMARLHAVIDWTLAAIDAVAPRWWAVENVVRMRGHIPPMVPYQVIDSAEYSAQARKRIFVGSFPRPAAGGGGMLIEKLLPGPYRISPPTLRMSAIESKWFGQRGLCVKRVLNPLRPSPTVLSFGSAHERGAVIEMGDGRQRCLQFTEGAALQGFPSDYVFVGAEQRAWKMVAQAVQIDTARAILRGVVEEAEREAA